MPGLEEIRLHLADEVLPLWHAVQVETDDPDAPLPFWAFAWGGGLAIARYLRDHPEAVAGRRVFDLASGSGLCAIAAMRAGATEAMGVDIDAFAVAAIHLNGRANGCRVTAVRRDVLDEQPPDTDVVLAGTRLAPAASATAKLHATPSGLAIELDVSGLPPSAPGFYYQAWMKGPRGLVTIGTFHMRGGPGTVELWSAVSLAGYPTITVTREPEDGNPASSGQVVLTNRHP